MMAYKIKDTITKKKLIEHFPEHCHKSKRWDKEDKKWKEINLKDRLKGRSFTFTKIEQKDVATMFECKGDSQKVFWIEYTMKKKTVILSPRVLPLVMPKPKPKSKPKPKEEEGS